MRRGLLIAVVGLVVGAIAIAVSGSAAAPGTLAPPSRAPGSTSVPPPRPAGSRPPAAVVVSPSAEAVAEAAHAPPPVEPNVPYDDAPLYRGARGTPAVLHPASAQGVLAAFRARAREVAACRAAHAPAAPSLRTVEVRVSRQDEGPARIEEVQLGDAAGSDLTLAGCLVRAVVEEGFEVPEAGFVRVRLPVELEAT